MVSTYYPSTTFKNYMINFANAGLAAPVIKTFAPARSAKKFVLLGKEYTKELHGDVDPSQLPRRLGGSLDNGVQWMATTTPR